MKKVKTILSVALLVTMVVLSTSALFTPVEAEQNTVYYAGTKIYDQHNKVIGCDCPAMKGNCICSVTPVGS